MEIDTLIAKQMQIVAKSLAFAFSTVKIEETK